MPVDALRVAAAQLACSDDDLDANLAAHLGCIGEARAAGVDLLLFPELSLTGYAGAVAAWQAGRLPGEPALRQLAEAAGPMAVAVGLPEEGGTGLLHNTQLVLRAGAVIHRHRKLNLPTYGGLEEGKHFAPGCVVEPFRLEHFPSERDRPDGCSARKGEDPACRRASGAAEGRLGAWSVAVLICADTWNPALPWLAALAGADLLLAPVASAVGAVGAGFDSEAGWDVNLRHTAMTYGLPIVMANHAGDGAAGSFWGGSRILGAQGEVLARAGNGAGVIQAGLDRASVRAARRLLPTRSDAAPHLVARELERRLSAADQEACLPPLK